MTGSPGHTDASGPAAGPARPFDRLEYTLWRLTLGGLLSVLAFMCLLWE